MDTNPNLEASLFTEALRHPPGSERDAFLNGACRGDKDLRERLEALLKAYEISGTTLEPPVAVAAPPTLRIFAQSSPAASWRTGVLIRR